MFFIKLLSKLHINILYLITDGLFFFVYYIIGYRKKVVHNNIANSFPEKNKKEVKAIAKKFYRRFGEYIAETLKAISISEDTIKKRVRFINVEEVQKYADQNQSIILVGSHQFNWEWALLTGCLVLPFPVDAVYQRLSNPKFDQLMYNTRAKFGGKPIHKKSIIRSLLKTKERLRAVAIMADQSPGKDTIKYWATFMNQETAFFLGPEQIAKAMKYPVVFYKMVRVKRGYYNVELIKLTEPPYEKESHEVLESYITESQKQIEDDPAGYLWSHKRWKLKKD
ncbi:MAG TPA: lysophospholipid acyltransferase family protein [Fulvivirga sp.]|nr:lysophospholipid acyltransferase family protein [Fulvivirga sp.]